MLMKKIIKKQKTCFKIKTWVVKLIKEHKVLIEGLKDK